MKSILARISSSFLLFSLVVTTLAQTMQFPVKRTETPETWKSDGWRAVERAKKVKMRQGKAKNVILFVGDGMGVSTLTAARILEGQLRGESGEENRLSFEEFPFSALSKTYSANQQTSDSAPTMDAIITGIKTNDGVISVNQNVSYGNFAAVKGNETTSLIELAEKNGRSTGVVSTARLTHATPAACYSHSANRNWESDNDILVTSKDAYAAKTPDIASQLIDFKYGDGLEVAMGGGRAKFLPKTETDPEYTDKKGERLDGRNIPQEWLEKYKKSSYVYDKNGFDSIDPKKTKHLLGLFERSHMQYEAERKNDKAGEPSLSEMTSKAIDILSTNKKGYVLMVEGGRIDHSHHEGNAYHALTDAIELSNAVRTATQKVNLDETLIVVTADHSHTFVISGYPMRGNNILGLTQEPGKTEPKKDSSGKPYTTLNYLNGPGYRGGIRPFLTQEEVTKPDYKQEAMIPLSSETHGGEDVAIFATGVNAHLIRGSMEENWIFYVMADALRLKN